MALAALAAQQTAAQQAAIQAASARPASTQAAAAGANALGSLSSNFSSFLGLLMTQLRNQDPTSPMDTNQFTQQLVQFSSVEQQIATNSSLTRLIELTQAGEVMQSSAMIGRRVSVDSDTMPLQSGPGGASASIRFEAPRTGLVQIAILSESGVRLRDASMAASKGSNDFVWDGKDATGRTLPDGAYRVAVGMASEANGAAVALPFTVTGTATGVETQANGLRLKLGAVAVPFSAVRAVVD